MSDVTQIISEISGIASEGLRRLFIAQLPSSTKNQIIYDLIAYVPATPARYSYRYWTKDGCFTGVDQSLIPYASLFRSSGPNLLEYNNNILIAEYYYSEGRLHRDDGPSVIHSYHTGNRPEYWLAGKYYVSKSEWEKAVSLSKELDETNLSYLIACSQ